MARKRSYPPDDEPGISESISSRPMRNIRRLPSRAITQDPTTLFAYTKPRPGFQILGGISSDDELPTDRSDVESVLTAPSGADEVDTHLMELDLVDPPSSPFKEYREGSALDEGEEIDNELSYKGDSVSPSLSAKEFGEVMYFGKGKERVHQCNLVDQDSKMSDAEGEADDEEEVDLDTRVTKKARHTLGPTQSIMEITDRVSNLGRVLKYDMEDNDDIVVSSSLPSIPISPIGPSYPTSFTGNASQVCGSSRALQRLSSQRRHRRQPFYRRPARSDSGSDDDRMITSDVERDMERVDNEVKRRESHRAFPARLPGQFTTAKLVRKSPTSLLPIRARPAHLRAEKSVHRRERVKGMYDFPKVMVGQLLLAAAEEGRKVRERRRNHLLVANKRLDKLFELRNYFSGPAQALLPAAPVVEPKLPMYELTDDEDIDIDTTYRTRSQRAKDILRNRTLRDKRRLYADRSKRNVEPIRLPPPIISPSFRPILLSPVIQPQAQIQSPLIPHLAHTTFEPEIPLARASSPARSETMSIASEMSEPPEYEEPPMPLRISLPPHLRPRPAPRPPSNEVPEYTSLPGTDYSRRSPPPPPPFNAQTDHHVLVAARFLDDDEVDQPVEQVGQFAVDDIRPWAAEQVREQEQALARYDRYQPRPPMPHIVASQTLAQPRRYDRIPLRAPIATSIVPATAPPYASLRSVGSAPAFLDPIEPAASMPGALHYTEAHPSNLVVPVPRRAYVVIPDSAAWDAAADLEEGGDEGIATDEEEGQDDEVMAYLLGDAPEAEAEAAVESELEAEDAEQENEGVMGTLGRMVRSVWRWV